jgi:hypothetical protein
MQRIKQRRSRIFPVILLVLSALLVVSVSTCALTSHARNDAFDKIEIGQTRPDVVEAFGVSPSFAESAGVGFPRYASQPCHDPCAERLWFENRLSMDMEAWSVELDGSGHVIEKTRWQSP